jgi:hypothetical protein
MSAKEERNRPSNVGPRIRKEPLSKDERFLHRTRTSGLVSIIAARLSDASAVVAAPPAVNPMGPRYQFRPRERKTAIHAAGTGTRVYSREQGIPPDTGALSRPDTVVKACRRAPR